MKQKAIIVATDQNNAIGKDNQLMWKLSSDLQMFKKLTTNQVVIMGRKTYDSIGRPLPNRINIVITQKHNLNIENVIIVHSIEDALTLANQYDKEIFIIGGEMIYELGLPFCNTIYLTQVHTLKSDADAFFPKIDINEWELKNMTSYKADEKNEFDFDFIELHRKLSF